MYRPRNFEFLWTSFLNIEMLVQRWSTATFLAQYYLNFHQIFSSTNRLAWWCSTSSAQPPFTLATRPTMAVFGRREPTLATSAISPFTVQNSPIGTGTALNNFENAVGETPFNFHACRNLPQQLAQL